MAAKLREWDDEILKLESKADQLKDKASDKYREQITDLKEKSEETRQKLKQLRGSGGEAWHELKDGLEKSWESLESSVKKAWSILRA